MSDIEEFNDDFNNIIHINIKQFKTRKFATTVSGIPEEFDYPKILRFWKKTFNCNGRIEEKDKVKNKDKTKQEREKKDNQKKVLVITISGDHREEVSKFLQNEGIALRENIKVHGA